MTRRFNTRGNALIALLAGLLGVVVGAGLILLAVWFRQAPSARPGIVAGPAPLPTAAPIRSSTPQGMPPDSVADAVARVEPAVVNIDTTVRVRRRVIQDGPFGPGYWGETQVEEIPQGMGTGVLVSPDGVVLTNNHVIRQAQGITVTLADDRQFPARVLGTDPLTDLAILKIDDPKPFPVAHLQSSEGMRTGDWVVALGNPLGIGQTATVGVLSARGRRLADASQALSDLLQTDAAINPGNSGGALVNLNGEVVGINTAIATRNGANQGVGFAIPINMASRIKNSLIQDGKVVRGWLGVNIQNLNESTAEIFGLDRPRGALVSQVVPGSPAADAGVRPRDVIIQLDGRPVKDVEDLQLRVVDRSPGTKVDLTVLRDGRERAIEVKLGELEAEAGGASGAGDNTERWSSRDDGRTGGLGLSLEELSREARRELQLPQSVDGVLVTDVDPAKPAGRAGLQRGDVITKVGDREVLSIRAFRDAIQDQDRGRPVLFEVQRGESQIFLGVKLPE